MASTRGDVSASNSSLFWYGNGWETVNDQNTSSSTQQEPVIPQVPSNIVENEFDSTSPQDPTVIAKEITIDGFMLQFLNLY